MLSPGTNKFERGTESANSSSKAVYKQHFLKKDRRENQGVLYITGWVEYVTF